MNRYEIIERALDNITVKQEAYRLGIAAVSTDPMDCIEMRALLDACAEEDRDDARRWFGMGLVVSA
jgi:hypothetical protein